MTTSDIESVEMVQPISLHSVPRGEYNGTWGGYEVTVIIHGEQFRFRTKNGIRTTNAKCTIVVTDNSVIVKLRE